MATAAVPTCRCSPPQPCAISVYGAGPKKGQRYYGCSRVQCVFRADVDAAAISITPRSTNTPPSSQTTAASMPIPIPVSSPPTTIKPNAKTAPGPPSSVNRTVATPASPPPRQPQGKGTFFPGITAMPAVPPVKKVAKTSSSIQALIAATPSFNDFTDTISDDDLANIPDSVLSATTSASSASSSNSSPLVSTGVVLDTPSGPVATFGDVLCNCNLPAKACVTQSTSSSYYGKVFYTCVSKKGCFWKLHDQVAAERKQLEQLNKTKPFLNTDPEQLAQETWKISTQIPTVQPYKKRAQLVHDVIYEKGLNALPNPSAPLPAMAPGPWHPVLQRKNASIEKFMTLARLRGYSAQEACAWESTQHYVDLIIHKGPYRQQEYFCHVLSANEEDGSVMFPVTWLHAGEGGPIYGENSRVSVMVVFDPQRERVILLDRKALCEQLEPLLASKVSDPFDTTGTSRVTFVKCGDVDKFPCCVEVWSAV